MSVASPVPPATMKPGTRARFSMKAMMRLMAKAETTYRPVTAR